jgi:acetoin utilization deacetylase AcuC-like enzyme
MNEFCYFYPERHELHFEANNPERPARIEAIVQSLDMNGFWDPYPKLSPFEPNQSLLESIHSPSLLAGLPEVSRLNGALDSDTYTTPYSWELALKAAGGAVAVAAQVFKRESNAGFALCRPPGHHATPNQAMGFCLLNNVAIAAQCIVSEHGAKKVAIIDLDVHHGNGTQDIFYERDDVLFISIHQIPLYPGTGQANEIGKGQGEGATINLPLAPYAGDSARQACLEEVILPALGRYQPEMVLVSAGFDAHWKDPLAHQLATASGYGQMVAGLQAWANQHCEGRIVLILEGGYDLSGIAASASACVAALLGKEFEDPVGKSKVEEENDWQQAINEIKRIHGFSG